MEHGEAPMIPPAGRNPARRTIGGDRLAEWLLEIRSEGFTADRIVFLCIGTDRSTGDAFGPLTGTLLEEAGFPYVIGTLERPCDSANLAERLAELPDGRLVIAVDACLGMGESVGRFQVAADGIEPGKSMGCRLPAVGHYSVLGVVNRNEGNPYKVLQNTSLHLVLQMARRFTRAAAEAFGFPAAAPLGAIAAAWGITALPLPSLQEEEEFPPISGSWEESS
ncbi:hypothetical protein J31TS4_44480 [Paenibacillus sp. J31TS4]|uniref:spore protease YyaC n=1 Tax=Paenibacillus sp. J31TS4 TaxID=2807195 RepID=UPI001B1D640E|nr:spore protease YyaC [Paenibacillus sp. J31TS4]GIP41168.1 hypothetical protein J31TS4_44480 [Paenibacillus sp. J31TS4]